MKHYIYTSDSAVQAKFSFATHEHYSQHNNSAISMASCLCDAKILVQKPEHVVRGIQAMSML